MGKLIFRYGTMGSGKSTHLLQVLDNYKRIKKSFLLLKPEIDTKGSNKVTSRLGIAAECNFLIKEDDNIFGIISFLQKIGPIDVVLIDEAQFLKKEQIDQLLRITTQYPTDVVCYGLRTNFKTNDEGFEGATRLLQIAHSIEEIKMLCNCGKKAIFNARYINGEFTTKGNGVEIDNQSHIEYRALCEECYLKNIK